MLLKHLRDWCLPCALAIGMSVLGAATGRADHWLDPPDWDGWLRPADWHSLTVRGQQPTVPGAAQPAAQALPDVADFASIARELTGTAAQATPASESASSVASENTDAQAFRTNQPSEMASVIQQSRRVQTTEFQKRSQLALDPNIRGYQGSSVYVLSDGAYWAPIRPDLDSIINRLDPSLYEDISIISGPYGLRYGPGFAFMRVLNVDTPRNANGYESSFRTGVSTRTNGGQLYGRQTVAGGSCDWGYIINYGGRVGGDYDPGGNSVQPPIPGSYKSQSLLGQVGFDLSPESSLEFRFRRLDDTGIEYPLQFFDVDYLGVDAYSLHYDREDACGDGTTSAMVWYSRSRFHGDTFPQQPVSPYYSVSRVNTALDVALDLPVGSTDLTGFTRGHHMITGARANKTYGDPDWTMLSVGADIRYMTQRINEDFEFRSLATPLPNFYTNLPMSDFVNPGMYSELTLRWLPYLSSTVGARVDWVHTTTDVSEFRDNSNLWVYEERNELDQNDVLYSFYLSNALELSPCWTARLGAGYSQRPPSTLERYADGVFVSMAQTGLSRVIGTPTLQKEKLWQVDAGLEARYERWAGRVGGFYSWVDDPVTFIGFPANDPTGAYLLRYTNGNLFLRTGLEALAEWNLHERWTLFGTARYVWGEDHDILVQNLGGTQLRSVPLVGIYPFSSNLGIRLHDPEGGRRWGLEFAALMVASQNRTGSLRLGTDDIVGLDPRFESRTGGFTTVRLGGYFNVTEKLYVVGGVDNLFDRTYLEHLNQRLPQDNIGGRDFSAVGVLAPGITPYVGVEWNY